MKPIVNTTYQTRDGREATVLTTDRPHPEYKVVATVVGADGSVCEEIYTHKEGSNVCYSLKGRQRGEDIILCPLVA